MLIVSSPQAISLLFKPSQFLFQPISCWQLLYSLIRASNQSMGAPLPSAAGDGEWLCEAEWCFVQQVVFCGERIKHAKVQQQLLPPIKAV